MSAKVARGRGECENMRGCEGEKERKGEGKKGMMSRPEIGLQNL